ncbi:oxidoreductase [Streptomyces sp. NPDC056361]|uniref:oxidoreductase n=1 Tax=Streptomyces sp. NPDC056361 TaxID=3345795 RepID=UPI0035DE80B6
MLCAATRPQAALRASGAARVGIVSSGAHRTAPFDVEEPHFELRPYDPWAAYRAVPAQDGTGFLYAVGARRWAADGITANGLNHPGFVLTGLQRHLDDATLRTFGVMEEEGSLTSPPFYKTPAQGAATSVLLAASPLLHGVTGRYFEDEQEAGVVRGDEGRPGGAAARARGPEAAARLWGYGSATLAGA